MWSVLIAAVPVFALGAVFLSASLRASSKKDALRAAKIMIAAAVAGAVVLAVSIAVFASSAAQEADKALAFAARADFVLFLKIDLSAVIGFTLLMMISLAASPRLAPVRGVAAALWALLTLMFTYAASEMSSGTVVTTACIMTAGVGAALLSSLGAAAELAVLGKRVSRDEAFRKKRVDSEIARKLRREKKRAAAQKRRSLKKGGGK